MSLGLRREWRACVADKDSPDDPEEESRVFPAEQEARDELARMLDKGYADPPYDLGWVEWRDVNDWERLLGQVADEPGGEG